MLQDVQAGMARQAALEAFAERTDVADVRHFVLAVGQANRYGVPDRRRPAGAGDRGP